MALSVSKESGRDLSGSGNCLGSIKNLLAAPADAILNEWKSVHLPTQATSMVLFKYTMKEQV